MNIREAINLIEAINRPTLYHKMRAEKAENVFANDRMPARWTHRIPGIGPVMGNSFTRNPQLRFNGAVTLTVDHTKLAQTNRIIPLDAEYMLPLSMEWEPGTYASNRWDRKNRPYPRMETQWREEFVVGDIKNLHRVITQIHIHGADDMQRVMAREFIRFVEAYAEKFAIPCTIEPSFLKHLDELDRTAQWDD